MVSRERQRTTILSFLLVAALTGCAESQSKINDSGGSRDDSDERVVIVSVAASAREVIERLAEDFQAVSDTRVQVNSGPSSGLANQIIAGAPADLLLSANQQWADELERAGKAEATVRLLTNKLVLVVPANNPADVHEPGDLKSPKAKKVALAGDKVPAGIYAEQSLGKLGLLDELLFQGKVVRGHDVRSALGYVERGEAEAGIVYSTDVKATPGVKIEYEFDPQLHDEIVYVMVLVRHDGQNPEARTLYEFLQSDQVNTRYAEFGFTRLP
jgi:molybdate transport system substrate-binding protein